MEFLSNIFNKMSTTLFGFIIAVVIAVVIFAIIVTGTALHIGRDGLDLSKPDIGKSVKKISKSKVGKESASVIQALIAIVNFQTNSQAEEMKKISDLEQRTLVSQLNYCDDKFASFKNEFYHYFRNPEKDSIEISFSIMMFEKTYEGFRQKIIDIIKANHLAEKTDLELKEQMETQTRIGVNYISAHLDDFPSLEDKDKASFIADYERTLSQIVKDTISKAKDFAVQKQSQVGIIQAQYKTERSDYLKEYLTDSGLPESEVKDIIDKTFR